MFCVFVACVFVVVHVLVVDDDDERATRLTK